jgi:hypothetical protein
MNENYMVVSVKDLKGLLRKARAQCKGDKSGDKACVVLSVDIALVNGKNQVQIPSCYTHGSAPLSPLGRPNRVAERVLWSFTFIGGGFNQVYAVTKDEALAQARRELPTLANQIDENSFKALRTRDEQDAYYAAFPNMD